MGLDAVPWLFGSRLVDNNIRPVGEAVADVAIECLMGERLLLVKTLVYLKTKQEVTSQRTKEETYAKPPTIPEPPKMKRGAKAGLVLTR